MNTSLSDLLSREVILAIREHPRLRGQLQRAARAGDVSRVVPGVWARTSLACQAATRGLAICRIDPRAVVIGDLAAALTYRRVEPGEGRVVVARRGAPLPGFTFVQARVSPEHVMDVGGLRLSTPAWTALDLALRHGSAALDEALRRGVPLSALTETLTAFRGRRGVQQLGRWVEASRHQPWSPAERAAHVALEAAGISGWVGNLRIDLPTRVAFVDIGVPALQLGFEIDGYAFHSGRGSFLHDRSRDIELAANGWHIVRFPAAWALDEPERFIASVRAIIAHRRRRLTGDLC